MNKEKKEHYHVLSLGAGVQSTVLALMAKHGEITPMPDFAVFADTGAEPQEVYDWLDWLDMEADLPFPIIRVFKGDLTKDSFVIKEKKKTGKKYVNNLIPLFGKLPNGEVAAALGRKCTFDYKITPIIKKIREVCQIERGQKHVTVTQWIGISKDEMQRMKYSSHKWMENRYPLIEQEMHRHQCIKWMRDKGYPEPPRSACYYCPFHNDEEWRRLRNKDPKHFQMAVEFDKKIREYHGKHNEDMSMEVYLHRSCKPLDQVDFDNDEDKGQLTWDFQSECEGMCGV